MGEQSTRRQVGGSSIVLIENAYSPSAREESTRSFALLAQAATGMVHLGLPSDGGPLTASSGTRWDLSLLPAISIDLEPGEQLHALAPVGVIPIDTLALGR